MGDADASMARAKVVTKQPRPMEQDEEPPRKAEMLVQEVSRSIAALSHPLECGTGSGKSQQFSKVLK